MHIASKSLLIALLIAACAACAWPAQAEAKRQGPCRFAALPAQKSTPAKFAKAVHCLINKKRTARGLRKLRRVKTLNRTARKHSRLMRDRRCFAHRCPGEGDLGKRIAKAGYGYRIAGENIAWAGGRNATPKWIVRAWMRSPGHRANILRRDFRDTGIGVVRGAPVRFAGPAITITQNFGRR